MRVDYALVLVIVRFFLLRIHHTDVRVQSAVYRAFVYVARAPVEIPT